MSVQHARHDGDVYDDRDRPFDGGIIFWPGRSVPEQNPDSIHTAVITTPPPLLGWSR